jgi:hypothetical protein
MPDDAEFLAEAQDSARLVEMARAGNAEAKEMCKQTLKLISESRTLLERCCPVGANATARLTVLERPAD